jgi:hypothetical protein
VDIFSQKHITTKLITPNRVKSSNNNIITLKKIHKYLENTVEGVIIKKK